VKEKKGLDRGSLVMIKYQDDPDKQDCIWAETSEDFDPALNYDIYCICCIMRG